jgi:hypothetical protein
MGIKDYEEAIDALNRGIEIDEIKIRYGHVRCVHGHMGSKLLLWDAFGFAYSFDISYPIDESVIPALQEILRPCHYVINPEFDLKFKK